MARLARIGVLKFVIGRSWATLVAATGNYGKVQMAKPVIVEDADLSHLVKITPRNKL